MLAAALALYKWAARSGQKAQRRNSKGCLLTILTVLPSHSEVFLSRCEGSRGREIASSVRIIEVNTVSTTLNLDQIHRARL